MQCEITDFKKNCELYLRRRETQQWIRDQYYKAGSQAAQAKFVWCLKWLMYDG